MNKITLAEIKKFIKEDAKKRGEYKGYEKFYEGYFNFLKNGLILGGDIELQAAYSDLNNRIKKHFKNQKFTVSVDF